MSSVKKRPDGQWRARYRGPDGKERAKHFARKVDAEQWVAGVEVARTRGEWTSPELGRTTLTEWAEQWMAGQTHLKASTRARYEGLLRKHVVPAFGPTRLGDLHHADVVAWVSDLTAAGLAGSTVRHAHRVLSLMLALAVKDGRIARNVAEGVRLPRAKSAPRRYLDDDRVGRLADACDRYRVVVLVLAYCGLRFGELITLRVRDVDLMRRRLRIERAAAEVRGRLVVGTPKDHQRRSVPIPRFLVDELAVALAGRDADDLAFPAPKGGMLRNGTFRRGWFDAGATAAGVEDLTPHELRHTAASLAVAAGANVKAVQRMLGHESAAMTLDVYTDLFDDDLDGVADRLHERWLAAGSGERRADQVRTGDVVELGDAQSATS